MPVLGTTAAASARGFGFGAGTVLGEQNFLSPGTYTFYVPTGVTSLTMVSIGGAGGGTRGARFTNIADPYSLTAYSPVPGSTSTPWYSGGGGALAYKNAVSVTPGQALTVVVGVGGGSMSGDADGGDTYVANASGTKLVHAGKGFGGTSGAGGTVLVGDGGGAGGAGGNWNCGTNIFTSGGGGGAGGYTGSGGAGGNSDNNGSSGSGGAAGGGGGGNGGSYYSSGGNVQNIIGVAGGAGGGTGLFGAGSSGAGGIKPSGPYSFNSSATGGGGGSGGTLGRYADGTSGGNNRDGTLIFGVYGGGGGGPGTFIRYTISPESYQCTTGFPGDGQNGAVRIIWSTNTSISRAFPSTNVGQL